MIQVSLACQKPFIKMSVLCSLNPPEVHSINTLTVTINIQSSHFVYLLLAVIK